MLDIILNLDGVGIQQIGMLSILFEIMVRPAILSPVETIRRQVVRLTSMVFIGTVRQKYLI